jgi:hypothetical protein
MSKEEKNSYIERPPKTIEDFEICLKSVYKLMANPYCDHLMFMSLAEKRDRYLLKIEELKQKALKNE